MYCYGIKRCESISLRDLLVIKCERRDKMLTSSTKEQQHRATHDCYNAHEHVLLPHASTTTEEADVGCGNGPSGLEWERRVRGSNGRC